MTEQETIGLLAFMTSIDGRNLTDLSVDAWHEIIGQVPADTAQRAARAHYANSREWLMPAHIMQAWRDEQAQEYATQRQVEAANLPPHQPRSPERLRELVAECERAIIQAKGQPVPEIDA